MIEYPFNLAWAQKAARDLEPGRLPNIKDRYVLILGLTSRCNFDCPICYYHGKNGKDPGQDMPLDLLKTILDGLPSLAGITIAAQGEPLLYPHFFEALQIIAQHTKGIGLVTNGSLLDAQTSARLNQFPIVNLTLSIDAADEKNYARFRAGGKLCNLKNNVSRLPSELLQTCMFHATVFQQNLKTLLDLPALAKELGIKVVSFQQLRSHAGAILRGATPPSQSCLTTWLDKMLENALKNDIILLPDRFFGGPSLIKKLQTLAAQESVHFRFTPSNASSCAHAENAVAILADGSLFPCGGDFAPIRMEEYSFESLFNHPYLLALRAMRRTGRPNAACNSCMNIDSKL